MEIRTRKAILKSGESVTIRAAQKRDALAFLKLLKQWSEETDFLLRSPSDSLPTMQEEEALLEKYLSDPRRAMILAEADGKILGNCSVFPRREASKSAHRAVFGIALIREAWGKGLGEILTRASIETAASIGYLQLELEVLDGNERAIALYRKTGFRECGRWPGATRQPDGRFVDEILMIRDLR